LKIAIALLSILFFSTHYAQEINFEKLNELYYNLNEYDFNGFSADVEFNILDQLKNSLKDEKYISILNKISMKLNFYSKDSVEFITLNVEETDNQQFNQGLAQTINGAEETVKGFLQSWAEISLTPAFEPNKFDYNIHTVSNNSKIQYTQEGSEVSIYLNNTNIDSISFINASSEIKMYPTYETTTFDKRIIKTMVTSINNYIELKMDIIYQDFDYIKIPHLITVTQSMQGMSQELKFTLKNISFM
jgi:hypothetical protein